MYKAMFQNSKIALLFAIVTIMSAVSMVGTSEDSGLLLRATSIVEAQRDRVARDAEAFAEARSVGDAPPPAPVFDDYAPGGSSGSQQPGGTASPSGGSSFNPMNAPLAPGARVDTGGAQPVVSEPYISEREVTIEPQ
jgi:hypothetical protein